MITQVQIKNFKILDDVTIELGKAVVFIGQNNSGKTTALQALALWEIGLKKWNEKRKDKSSPEKRSGVTINRNDLISIPIPYLKLLWHDMRVSNFKGFSDARNKAKPISERIKIDIIVDGITNGKSWSCGLEFEYANDESFYCRPLRISDEKQPKRMPIPPEAADIKIAFLHPMSGLAAIEPIAQPGRINVLLGEGQTAQVLRNLCYLTYEESRATNLSLIENKEEQKKSKWEELIDNIKNLFGVEILPPRYIVERGEITMRYKEMNGVELDISSSGRGLQQTLLLLAYLYSNLKTILLLDEPDAHLEILRQRQIYHLITEIAEKQGSQIIAASHSEIVLNDAADRDLVIAFVGKPHRIDDRVSQVLKALKEIGYEQYYMAEQKGWVLYLEGATDLSILKTFAKTLKHKAFECLENPFFCAVGTNIPAKARNHFYGLIEAKKDLRGIAIFDKIDKALQENTSLVELMWKKREIENYLCFPEILLSYASNIANSTYESPNLFTAAESERRNVAMKESIQEITDALKTLKKISPWDDATKVTDDFFDPLFEKYFEKLNLPNLLRKTDYHVLAVFVPYEMISKEIIEKLDLIYAVANGKK